MDFAWDEIGQILSYLMPAIIIVIMNVFFRKHQEQKKRQTLVRSLLSDINYNQKLMDAFAMGWQMKKFKTGTWKQNKEKLDYISPDLRSTLGDVFDIAEQFNGEIGVAMKHKSAIYMANIQVDRLRGPLARSQQGLEEWLQENKGKEKILKRGKNSTP